MSELAKSLRALQSHLHELRQIDDVDQQTIRRCADEIEQFDARIAAAEAAAYERVRAICERLGLSCAHFALAEIDALITPDQQSALDARIAAAEARMREECARIALKRYPGIVGRNTADAIRDAFCKGGDE